MKMSKIFAAKVLYVRDADTYMVAGMNSEGTFVIRLDNVDCPELSQAFGKISKFQVALKIENQIVDVELLRKDRYNRHIANIFFNNYRLDNFIIENGFGWVYEKYNSNIKLVQLQYLAKEKKLGLWAFENPVKPSVYRNKTKKHYLKNV